MKLSKKQIADILKLKPETRRVDGRPPVKMIAAVAKWKGKKIPEKMKKVIALYKERIALRESQSGESAGKLAKKYGVNSSTIYRIWQGKIGK